MTDIHSSRRDFLKAGAFAAAPLAIALPAAAGAVDARHLRLARLENEAAIRALHRNWLRNVNAGAHGEAATLYADPRRAGIEKRLMAVTPDALAEEHVTLSNDGLRATARFACTVETELPAPGNSTLAQMAQLQGNAAFRHAEPRVISADYVKAGDRWAIARLEVVAA